MKKKYLVTSALLYSNGTLHFGHLAGAYLPADCFSRAMRLEKHDVLYISGSDEYGVAITLSAEKAKKTPKEHSDLFHKENKELFEKLNFSFDHYSRTTWEGHIKPTQTFFSELLENGYIEEKVTEQLFSEEDQRFLADRYVEGICPKCGAKEARGDECIVCGASYEATDLISPKSKLTGSDLVKKPTTNWFMRFDLFKEKLTSWLSKKDWKPNVVNFVQSYIEDLKPRAITRDSDWGVKIPLENTEGKVLYVWFDAPIGYISATQEWAKLNKDPTAWERYWLDPETRLVNFIGKDNIPFHAIFFPAMCMGQNTPYKLVDDIPANEFLNLEGKQFSKSAGWTIDIHQFLKDFDVDQIRYYLAANAPETSDAEFSWKEFQTKCNTELVGKFGNLVNRTFVFSKKHCDLTVSSPSEEEDVDRNFIKDIKQLTEDYRKAVSQYRLRKAVQIFMEMCQIGNVYFDHKKPWVDAKELSSVPRMKTTIYHLLDCLRHLSIVAYPVMPKTAEKLFNMLGFKEDLLTYGFEGLNSELLPLQKLLAPEILFKKLEDDLIEKHHQELLSGSKIS